MKPLKLFIVAGEHSGDELGGPLLAAIKKQYHGTIELAGVGGKKMAAEGLSSLLNLDEIAVMGPIAILKKLPSLISAVKFVQKQALAFDPDILVIIDSPEFTHPVAKYLKKRKPHLKVLNYVCPSIWAWRPGRAKKMTGYIDHVLCLLPFEPKTLSDLKGPKGTYIGHPLSRRLQEFKTLKTLGHKVFKNIQTGDKKLVLLPGSRSNEVRNLLPIFKAVIARLADQYGDQIHCVLPTVPKFYEHLKEETKSWAIQPMVTIDENEKFISFAYADAALAASGTVTLELAMCGCPMVVAYKVIGPARYLRFLVNAPSIVLANLVLGEKCFPEFIQEDCSDEILARQVNILLQKKEGYKQQIEGLEVLKHKMVGQGQQSPSEKAASLILQSLNKD